ncbi:MAG: succinate dehydrogenase assembly factor 2 [Gammaproteobacteria bacterium]|nr:succinate dehydrogenase assembly factor 2 [Gammaproteobacteria bacterium]
MSNDASATVSRGRLRQLCRRGTLELDVLLERWLDNGYNHGDAIMREQFLRLLALEDDQLQVILVRGESVPAELAELVHAIRRPPNTTTRSSDNSHSSVGAGSSHSPDN